MANRAYASIWARNFSEETIVERWREFLGTVPFSTTRPGFTELVIRAVDAAETPILELDLRSGNYDAEVLADLAREHVHSDCCYETRAFWDLWVYDVAHDRWEMQPQPLAIFCHGEDFDDGVWQESGHFLVEAGFEHFFTGHAGLLGFEERQPAAAAHPEEANFVAVMSFPENRRVYQERTRENIRKLFDWMRRVETVIPVERSRLWSEGEDNFEARMEEILAAR
ncbi:MAG: hypothetical protein WBD23_07030 [Candidatus Acidiferrales bacterium]